MRDFIWKIKNYAIPEDAVLLSMDVKALYTNIPHEEARNTVQQTLENDSGNLPPMHFILDLVDIVLENNYFCFADGYYFQTRGVSMGSPFVPSLANLFMTNFENRTILNQEHDPYFSSILVYFRFIDDCFCIFKGAHLINEFIDWLNTIHSTIKFTYEFDNHRIHFLDSKVFRTATQTLAVKPYVKPTDRNTNLFIVVISYISDLFILDT